MGRFPIQGVGTGGGGGQPFDPFNLLADPNLFWWWYDEFFYPTPSSHFPHWETFGSVSTVAVNIGGVIQTQSTAVINNKGGFKVCAGGLTAVDLSKKTKLIWRVRPRQAQANSAMRVGFFAGTGADPSGTYPYGSEDTDAAQRNHIYFGFDGTGNWFTKTRDGSDNSESTDTGVAVTTSAFVTLQIEIDPDTPSIIWTIDGNVVHTQTTNLPTGTVAIGVSVQTGVASSKATDVDSMFVIADR